MRIKNNLEGILADQKSGRVAVFVWFLLPLLYLGLRFYYQPNIPPLPKSAPSWIFTSVEELDCIVDQGNPFRRSFMKGCAIVRDERPLIASNLSKFRAELVARQIVEQYAGGVEIGYIDGQPHANRGIGPSLVEVTLPNGQKRRVWEKTLVTELFDQQEGFAATVYVDAETDEPLVLIKDLYIVNPPSLRPPLSNEPTETLKHIYIGRVFGPMIFGLYVIWVFAGFAWGFHRFQDGGKLDRTLGVLVIILVLFSIFVVELFLPYFLAYNVE